MPSRCLLVVVLLGLALAPTGALAQGQPPAPARSFSAVLRNPDGSELVAWQAPERLAVRALSGQPMLGGTFVDGGTVFYRFSARSPVSVLRNTFAALPDAPPLLQQLLGPRDFVLARVRAGTLALRPAGPRAWRVKLYAPANKCAGFGSGTIELWLRRADFLPLRLLEKHGSLVVRDFSLDYRSVDATLPAGTFTPPKAPANAYRDDKGFVRSSPAAARAHLSYAPLVPRSVPAGFALAVSGWATRSGTTGAEGSIAPARELFAAVYRRGSEEIDLTERLAAGRGWPSDPFGAECVRQTSETVALGPARAVYAASTSTTPHLYWRSGRLLYTLSGPLPKAQLATIARSLGPVA